MHSLDGSHGLVTSPLFEESGMKKRLYVEGHHVKRGYVVRLEQVDAMPVRYYKCHLRKVRAIIERFNRRFG